MTTTTNSGQGHLADNLEKQLNEIVRKYSFTDLYIACHS